MQLDGMALDPEVRHICFARYFDAFQNPLELTVGRQSPRDFSEAAEVAFLDVAAKESARKIGCGDSKPPIPNTAPL